MPHNSNMTRETEWPRTKSAVRNNVTLVLQLAGILLLLLFISGLSDRPTLFGR